MPNYFFDTSAVGKCYRAEAGSAKVDALLLSPGSIFAISRLATVEPHSAYARLVRTGHVTPPEFEKLTRRFRADVRAKRWQVVRVTVAHFESAVRLVRRVGLTRNLRTLDALQLAVALGLNGPGRPVEFVSADHALCAIAVAEGLSVINPETA
jgi:predicted nucleic acid-binding protein